MKAAVKPGKTIVVGGGLAGISAALELADGGAEVTLLERRSRLGGLTWSFKRKGRSFDNGQHVFLRCCTEYRRFLTRIGAEGQTNLQAAMDIPVLSPEGRRADLTRSELPAPLHLGAALARYAHLSLGDRVRLGRAALALQRLDLEDPALDEQAFGPWLRAHGQEPEAIERLWDLIILPTVNVHAEQASLALAAKVLRTGLLDERDGADVGWSKVPLGELHGANSRRALRQAGVEVVTGQSVTAVDGSGVATTESTYEAAAVVVAVDHETAATILPTGVVGDLSGLGTSPIVNVHLVLDRRVTDLPMAAAVGSPAQFVFDRTASAGIEPSSGQQCLVVSLSGADEWIGRKPGELVRTMFGALAELFPAARRARVIDGVVSREHAATFRGVPGTARLRRGPVTPVDGLYLAGAWCATGWPATMEGAVRSGRAAARAVLGEATGASEWTGRQLEAVA